MNVPLPFHLLHLVSGGNLTLRSSCTRSRASSAPPAPSAIPPVGPLRPFLPPLFSARRTPSDIGISILEPTGNLQHGHPDEVSARGIFPSQHLAFAAPFPPLSFLPPTIFSFSLLTNTRTPSPSPYNVRSSRRRRRLCSRVSSTLFPCESVCSLSQAGEQQLGSINKADVRSRVAQARQRQSQLSFQAYRIR
jgi:hypothetical protein